VWNDLDQDGLQDAGEPGINGVVVNLKNAVGAVIATTTTNGSGLYLFRELCQGKYTVEVDSSTLPKNFIPSPCNVPGSDTLDNDCSPAPVSLPTNNTTDVTIDFGYHTCNGMIGDFI
jgi:hypothetical protein